MGNHLNLDYLPPSYRDTLDIGEIILRDGTTAKVHPAQPKDQADLSSFFDKLSAESRRRVFFSATPPRPELVTSYCKNRDPRSSLTLIVTRTQGCKECIIATGSYFAKDDHAAEVTFAVDDSFHGKGLATLLLERLALLAVRSGFTRFWAITHADNQAMRDVFQQSGFACEERSDRGGEIEVDLSIIPDGASVNRLEARHRIATVASLRPFFHPSSVAVVGASATRRISAIGCWMPWSWEGIQARSTRSTQTPTKSEISRPTHRYRHFPNLPIWPFLQFLPVLYWVWWMTVPRKASPPLS